ncbi:reverse transcriptase zinc-binding domain-containing protein [Tanacetum coccineum]
MWMAIQERLVTQDRLARWYPSKTFSCALCDKCPDSHEHLFFKCEFSKTLWQAMVQKMNCNLPNKCSLLIPSMISLGFSNSIVKSMEERWNVKMIRNPNSENRIGSYRDGWTSIMWMMPLMDANPMISFVRWAAKEIMWLPS